MSMRACAAVIAVGLLAACGSQVSPEEIYGTQVGVIAANGSSVTTNPTGAATVSNGGSSAPLPTGGSSQGATGGAIIPSRSPTSGGSSGPGSSSATTTTPRAGSSSSATHATTSSAPAPATCKRTATKPSVKICPHSGLHDGQTITVEGWNFKPNTTLAVAECHDRGDATGLPDCNIDNVLTYVPGAKVKSDANGHIGPVTITVKKTFKAVDCSKVKCLVAVSEPTLSPDPSDEGDQYISFA